MIFKTKKINSKIFEEKNNNNLEAKYNEYINSLKSDFEKETAKNLIEKMAIWYELRYPDNIIEGFLSSDCRKAINTIEEVNDIMFEENQYFNYEVQDDLNWYDFYNAHTFISSLPTHEQNFFKPKKQSRYMPYTLFISFSGSGIGIDIWIDRKGYISTYSDIREVIEAFGDNVKADDIRGIHVKEFANYVEKFNKNNKEASMRISKWDVEKIEDTIYEMDRKEGLLDCVMYKILERRYKGVSYIGAYRAFMFAKEFNRDINIPMQYAFDDYTNEKVINFVKEFINCGGREDLKCHYRKNNKEFSISNIIDVIKKQDEEIKLQKLRQRLADALITKLENTATIEEKKAISKIEKQKVKTKYENN